MKPSFVLYRLLTFILLPLAGLIALNLVGILPAAFANPMLLIIVFLMFTIIAYTFASFIFLTRGLVNKKPLKPSLKDWVKINAYISIACAVYCILSIIVYYSSRDAQKMMTDNLPKMQAAMGISGKNAMDTATFMRMVNGTMALFGGYFVLLSVHIIVTLRLVKKNASLFGNAGTSSN